MENALNRRLKKLHCSSFGVALILSSACAGAAPAITNLEKGPAAAELEEGARIVLSGQGFGDKLQDPAVLYDHADSAWENGILNNYHASFTDMQLIQRIDEDSNTLWAKPSVPDDNNSGVLIAKSREARDGEPGSQYYGKGNNNFLGWPTAHGGIDVASDSDHMYASFWMKLPYDLGTYYAIPGDADSRKFIDGGDANYGERISIEGIDGYGRVIAYEPSLGSVEHGWLFFEPPVRLSWTSLVGKRITGVDSGTTILFPEESSKGKFDQYGFLAPRGKYARFWSSEGGNGYRFSMGNVGVAGTSTVFWAHKFEILSPTPGQWNFFEFELDVGDIVTGEKPSLTVRLNGEIFVEGNSVWADQFLVETAEQGLQQEGGLTPALLGINDFMSVPFSFDLDDIYFDDTLQRVMVCSRSTIASVHSGEGSCELQHIAKWDTGSIEFDTYFGALDTSKNDLFVYVFDENGVPNSMGFPLNNVSLGSPNPPSAVVVE
jgi:hypothetical protein